MRLAAAILVTTLAFALVGEAMIAARPDNRLSPRNLVAGDSEPAKVVGYESCAKCHENEVSSWKQTPHFATYDHLHRTPAAKAIAKRLGFRCITCHYTRQAKGDRLRAVSGVSCESCHGPANDWLALHSDYGGPTATKETESDQHRRWRRESSIARGMNNPTNLYLIAKQCLGCHTVPSERLVNSGGHIAGSQDFELVRWSQGTVRHNFLRTGGHANAPSSAARQRIMYVVGLLTDLEMSLRATSQATVKAPYGVASAQRAARLKRKLFSLQQDLDHPLLAEALDAALRAPLRLNQEHVLRDAADSISDVAYRFAEQVDGNALTAVDALLPTTADMK